MQTLKLAVAVKFTHLSLAAYSLTDLFYLQLFCTCVDACNRTKPQNSFIAVFVRTRTLKEPAIKQKFVSIIGKTTDNRPIFGASLAITFTAAAGDKVCKRYHLCAIAEAEHCQQGR